VIDLASYSKMNYSRDSVIQTNDDATSCKLSINSLGYIQDPYLQYFQGHFDRKSPLINRGYFCRVWFIHNLIREFARVCDDQFQIVSLGSGYDTTFWSLNLQCKYIEMDFSSVVKKKIQMIQKNDVLKKAIRNLEVKGRDPNIYD
jgi:O-methyltransferase involved in polyketide biosynthesis